MRFAVNNKPIDELDAAADMTLLRYLRNGQQLMGTKEGCASGDCGACTVIVGRPSAQGLVYSTVNACICPLGSLQDCHVITVEALAASADSLHPVQAAMVECHGSQCGFCTPGFVMSLVNLQLNQGAVLAQADEAVQRAAVIDAISGNLCRCTGYRPIVAAGMAALKKPAQVASFVQEWVPDAPLASITPESAALIPAPLLQGEGSGYWQPHTEAELQQLLDAHPQARLLAGGTDLMLEVTQQYKTLPQVIDLNRVASLQQVEVNEQEVILGAAVCYSQLEKSLRDLSPEFVALLGRLGSRQIRNRGTLGGNIGNASPIADSPPYLLALDAEVEIINGRGDSRREKLTHFYRDYKKTSLMTGEYIARIYIARAALAAPLKLFKLSKRYEDDISAVMGAFYWNPTAGDYRIAFGGMAAIPKRASATEQFLSTMDWCVNGVVDEQILEQACDLLRSEFSPLSDVRASAAYRLAMACNLLKKACYELAADAAGLAIETRLFAHA
ncbi:xanthine dehydrogenase small subunit [Cellvibrio mixtus]|uniref:Xanthine dehydrogenase small subunit n=1 Tax=Cellvibrio mixtus TaxID=39650 RepID=A0A266Q1H5_9GAMM|nr:xanthine dehydrogenase small subunit [Cellvibrio mixtus]OZY83713.1 xanthine dehydrogenase small subunit [Cellvibrio mixtus]